MSIGRLYTTLYIDYTHVTNVMVYWLTHELREPAVQSSISTGPGEIQPISDLGEFLRVFVNILWQEII